MPVNSWIRLHAEVPVQYIFQLSSSFLSTCNSIAIKMIDEVTKVDISHTSYQSSHAMTIRNSRTQYWHALCHQLTFLQCCQHFFCLITMMPERKGGKLSLTCFVSNLDKILGFLLPFSQLQKEQNSVFFCKRLPHGSWRQIKRHLCCKFWLGFCGRDWAMTELRHFWTCPKIDIKHLSTF